jgi:hypothetical protein
MLLVRAPSFTPLSTWCIVDGCAPKVIKTFFQSSNMFGLFHRSFPLAILVIVSINGTRHGFALWL